MKAKVIILLLLLISSRQIKCQKYDFFSPDNLINSTIRIECWHDTIINGVKNRITSIGTGFCFAFNYDKFSVPVIVTNAHIIRNMDCGVLTVNEKLNSLPKYGNILRDTISNFKNNWLLHPNVDLAIFPLGQMSQELLNKTKKYSYNFCFDERLIPNDSILKSISAIEEVYMIGYPKGKWDPINNVPIVRKGTTATPYFLDYQGKKEFLLDISVFPGSSGSPVVLFDPGSIAFKKGEIGVQNRISLLGIAVQMIPYDAKGEAIQKKDSILQTSTSLPMNLAIIIKSSELLIFKPIIQKIINEEKKNDIKK